jgi:signal transduction histidine kinase
MASFRVCERNSNPVINRLTLRFSSSPIERAYQEQVNEESLPLLRLSLAAAVFTIIVFYPSDKALFPQAYQLMWGLRTALCLPAVILCFGLSFVPSFPRYRGPSVWLAVSASGWPMPFCIVWYGEPGLTYFTSGTILVAMFALLMLGLPIVFAVLTTWSIVVASVGAITYVAPQPPLASTASQLLLVSCTVLTVAAYRTELLSRRLYLKSLQLIEEQERLRASEAQRSRWLEQMAGFFRHELKNSILGVQTSLQLLMRRTSEASALRLLVDRAKKGIELIDAIACGVSHATSVESTVYREQPAFLRLDPLVREALATYRNAYPACQFVYQCDDPSLAIIGREERVAQMLNNLVTNAVDHHAQGTPIAIGLARKDATACLEVANKGPLLPAEPEVLFDLFRSFRDARSQGEHQGIGLYIVKLIAERYGGHVEVANQADGTGVVARVYFPCWPPPVAAPASAVTHR